MMCLFIDRTKYGSFCASDMISQVGNPIIELLFMIMLIAKDGFKIIHYFVENVNNYDGKDKYEKVCEECKHGDLQLITFCNRLNGLFSRSY